MNLQKKEILEEQNGITLVALIVTMVVLLIIAGIAISSLVGDSSILRQAKRAEVEYVEGAQVEKNALDTAENYFYELFDRNEFGRRIGDIGLKAEVRGSMVAIRISVDGYTSVLDYLIGKGKDIIKETNTNEEKAEFMLGVINLELGEELTQAQAEEMIGGSLSELYNNMLGQITSSGEDSDYIMVTAMYFAGALTEEERDMFALMMVNQYTRLQAGIAFETPEQFLEYLNSQNSSTQYSRLREYLGDYYWLMADFGLLTEATKFVIENPNGTKSVLQGFNLLNMEDDLYSGTDIIYMYNSGNEAYEQHEFKVSTAYDSEVITIIYQEQDPTKLTFSSGIGEDEKVDGGLDVSFVVIKPDNYIEAPTTAADVVKYMTYEEKWEIGLAMVNSKAGTDFTTKEEAFEFMEVETEEEFWQKVNTMVPYITDLESAVVMGVSLGNYKIDDSYIEEFNKKYNSVAGLIDVKCITGDAQLEYDNNYGVTVYKIEKNGTYEFEMSYNGKVTDTKKVTVNNILTWSEAYESTKIYTDTNGATATIPKGFKVATTSGYNTVAEGLLVRSPEGSTYVWIPCTGLSQPTKTFTEGALNGTSYYPPEDFDDGTSYSLYARDPITIPNLDQYGGFYIGRYETSLQNGVASSVRTYSVDNLIRGVNISELTTSISNLYETNTVVGSQLMTAGVYEYIDNKYSQKGTSTSESVTGTGREPTVSTHNIYNLHDNLWEVTTGVVSRIREDGEYFDYEDCPVMYGGCSIPEHDWGQGASYPELTDCSGGRICLYLK